MQTYDPPDFFPEYISQIEQSFDNFDLKFKRIEPTLNEIDSLGDNGMIRSKYNEVVEKIVDMRNILLDYENMLYTLQNKNDDIIDIILNKP